MRMKTTVALLLALSAALIVAAGCGGDDDGGGGGSSGGDSSGDKKDLTVAFTTITLVDPFFVRLNAGAKEAADTQGVDLILNNPNGDPAAQANAVETFTQQGVDAIIFDAIDPNGIQPSLRAAQDQSIGVVAVDEVLAGVKSIDSSAGNDNFEVGKKLGEQLVKKVGEEEAHVGVVQTLDAPIENTRLDGFKSALEGHSNIKIVGRADAKFALDKAANGAENLITSDSDLNWFYTTGGIYGEGVLSAIKSQNKEGQIRMIGWDLTKQLATAMDDGTYVEAAQQDARAMGAAAVDAAVKLANGEKVGRFNYVPVRYVTRANLDEFRSEIK